MTNSGEVVHLPEMTRKAERDNEVHNGNRDDGVAILPNTEDRALSLAGTMLSASRAYSAEPNETARVDLLNSARSLAYSLETPREAMIRYCWTQSTSYAAIQTAIDLGLFQALSADSVPKRASELATKTGSDSTLLARLLKHLSAIGVVIETAPDEYRRTGFSSTMCFPRYSDGFPAMTNCITAGVIALPAHLKSHGYQTPPDGNQCAFQLGFNTDLSFFDFMRRHPLYLSQFNHHMMAYHQGRPSWMDIGFYPVPKLADGVVITESEVLIVDIGGGVGHDLVEFQQKWPEMPGRLILQDMPTVIEQAKKNPHETIEPMEHNFFTRQPVNGARVYYLHAVLHDWNDSDCERILANIVPAMKRGYSKVLINENVVPDMNAHCEITSLDLIMMANFGSMERTENQWAQLIESAGLKVTKVWTPYGDVESLIECELA